MHISLQLRLSNMERALMVFLKPDSPLKLRFDGNQELQDGETSNCFCEWEDASSIFTQFRKGGASGEGDEVKRCQD